MIITIFKLALGGLDEVGDHLLLAELGIARALAPVGGDGDQGGPDLRVDEPDNSQRRERGLAADGCPGAWSSQSWCPYVL